MSGYYEEDSDYYEENEARSQSGSGLRKQFEEALGEIRSLRGELEAERRTKTVNSLLESKGIDPAVAQLIPKDAKADEWLDQYSHLFANKAALDEATGEPSTPEVEQETEPDPKLLEEQREWERANGIAPTGTSTSAGQDPLEQLKAFQDETSLLNFIQSQGGGPALG